MGRLLDLAVGRNRYAGLEVPDGCTVGMLKELLGQGRFGAKILYPEKLAFRPSAAAGALQDSTPVPERPERVHVTGPHTVVKMLELALRDRMEASKPPPSAMVQIAGKAPLAGDGGRQELSLGEILRPAFKALQVQTPADLGPGSILAVEDPRTGKTFEVEVPHGTPPGGTFEVPLSPLTGGDPAREKRDHVAHAGGDPAREGQEAAATTRACPSAASVLAAPLDGATIAAIRARFPAVEGELPREAAYWSEADLERYLESGGQRWPRELGDRSGGQTCALLRELRMLLAERKVSDVPSEYRSLGKHFVDVDFKRGCSLAREGRGRPPLGLTQLPALAVPAQKVPKAARAPETLREPIVLDRGSLDAVRPWDLDFWRSQCGDAVARCHARAPRFIGDGRQGDSGVFGDAAAIELSTRVADYVDYARLLALIDAECRLEDAVAHFRVHAYSWLAFRGPLFHAFSNTWRSLVPLGVQDLTVRWVQMFAGKLGCDWLETLAGFYTVTLAAPGCMSRLHRERNGAHLWIAQTEGRLLVFLFPPSDSERLYEEHAPCVVPPSRQTSCSDESSAAGIGDWEDVVQCISPVDLFATPSRRHPLFREASAQFALLERGETLVVPSGWWWCSVALEPGASIQHRFFNRTNFHHVVRDLEGSLGRVGDGTADLLEKLRQEVAEDNEEWGLTVQDE